MTEVLAYSGEAERSFRGQTFFNDRGGLSARSSFSGLRRLCRL